MLHWRSTPGKRWSCKDCKTARDKRQDVRGKRQDRMRRDLLGNESKGSIYSNSPLFQLHLERRFVKDGFLQKDIIQVLHHWQHSDDLLWGGKLTCLMVATMIIFDRGWPLPWLPRPRKSCQIPLLQPHPPTHLWGEEYILEDILDIIWDGYSHDANHTKVTSLFEKFSRMRL